MAGSADGRPMASRSTAKSAGPSAIDGDDEREVGHGRVGHRVGPTGEDPLAPGRSARTSSGRRLQAMHVVRSPESSCSTALTPPTRRKISSARTVGRNGAGATWRPISSSRTASSTGPSPTPPSASGTAMPSQPWSTMAAQRSRSQRSGDSATRRTRVVAARSSRSARAPSRSASWSSERSKSIAFGHYLTPVSRLFRRCTQRWVDSRYPKPRSPPCRTRSPHTSGTETPRSSSRSCAAPRTSSAPTSRSCGRRPGSSRSTTAT